MDSESCKQQQTVVGGDYGYDRVPYTPQQGEQYNEQKQQQQQQQPESSVPHDQSSTVDSNEWMNPLKTINGTRLVHGDALSKTLCLLRPGEFEKNYSLVAQIFVLAKVNEKCVKKFTIFGLSSDPQAAEILCCNLGPLLQGSGTNCWFVPGSFTINPDALYVPSWMTNVHSTLNSMYVGETWSYEYGKIFKERKKCWTIPITTKRLDTLPAATMKKHLEAVCFAFLTTPDHAVKKKASLLSAQTPVDLSLLKDRFLQDVEGHFWFAHNDEGVQTLQDYLNTQKNDPDWLNTVRQNGLPMHAVTFEKAKATATKQRQVSRFFWSQGKR